MLMPRSLLAALLWTTFALHNFAAADEKGTAERLRGLGAQVTETKGAITAVGIPDASKLTAADYAALGECKQLKMLSLSGEGITDETLDALKGLTSLEDLSTNQAKFSDDGLKKLLQFPNLKQIKFFHTSLKTKIFNGSGLAQLVELKNLRRLTVAGCPFNDEGMAAVGKLTQLENFRTWHTFQTEAGNVHLKSLVNLKSLHLGQRLRHYDGTSNAHSLNDATLAVLAEMKSLEGLILDEARLSEKALEQLSALPKLKQLQLGRVERSDEDIAALQKALPNVEIEWPAPTAKQIKELERYLKP